MSQDDRFKPPSAPVADIDVEPGGSRAAVIPLALAGLLHLAWAASQASTYFELLRAGALRPIGLLFAAAGLGYLYLGIGRLVLRATVGTLHFIFASALLSLGVASCWNGTALHVVTPFLLGIVLAAAGWRSVNRRQGAVSASESP